MTRVLWTAEAVEVFRSYVKYDDGAGIIKEVVQGPYSTESAAQGATTRKVREINRWSGHTVREARAEKSGLRWRGV